MAEQADGIGNLVPKVPMGDMSLIYQRVKSNGRQGAESAGHYAEKINVAEQTIRGCLGCNGCQRNGGTCVQKDDMTELYAKILAADVVVLASPIY